MSRGHLVNIIHNVPGKGIHLSKSEVTRAKLLECTVQELLVTGADHFGFTAIARRAQLSTGALYARYENNDELLIDVWNIRAWPAFQKFISDAIDATASSDNHEASDNILDALERQDPDLVAAIALMIVARRNETLKEVVYAPVQALFRSALISSPAIVHVTAYLVGEIMVSKAFGIKTDGWREFIPELFTVGRDAVASPVQAQEVESFPNTNPMNIDKFDIQLFDALAEVIAVSGVERATVSRIARRANVNPATIYARYPSKNALISRCVHHYLSAVVKGYFALDERVTSADSLVSNMVHLFRARNSTKWEIVRRFRLESLYAAWHNEEIQSVYADAYMRITGHDVQALSKGREKSAVGFLNFSSFNRVVLFGHSLFFDYDLVEPDDELIASIESGVFEVLMNR